MLVSIWVSENGEISESIILTRYVIEITALLLSLRTRFVSDHADVLEKWKQMSKAILIIRYIYRLHRQPHTRINARSSITTLPPPVTHYSAKLGRECFRGDLSRDKSS